MKKKYNENTNSEQVSDKVAEARARRTELFGHLAKKEVVENDREEWRKFFAKLKQLKKLEADMENVLWLHLKSIGCDKKEKFEQGIKNFGY